MEDLISKLKATSIQARPVGLVTHADVCLHMPSFKACDHVEGPRRVSETVAYLLQVLSYMKDKVRIARCTEPPDDTGAGGNFDGYTIELLDKFDAVNVHLLDDVHGKEYVQHVIGCFDSFMQRHSEKTLGEGEKAIVKNKARKDAENFIFSFDMDMYINANSLRAIMLSAAGPVLATKKVLEGKWSNAFTLLRPPGHHAHACG